MRYLTILFATAALLFSSCIKNDIPYPIVQLGILGVEGEGFSVSEIDISKRIVTLTLDEKTNIRKVGISSVQLTDLTQMPDKVRSSDEITLSQPLSGTFDLRTPIYVTLSLYQDYNWSIQAVQPIARSFSVENQIGAAEFNEGERTAKTYVVKGTDLKQLTVNELKLGPAEITTYSPSLAELSGSSFESVRFVDVTCHGTTERWMLYVIPTETNVVLTQADAWTKVIWLYGAGIAGSQKMGFRYRKAGDEAWQIAPDVEIDGGNFSARIAASAETTYEVKAYCNDDETDPKTLTTDKEWQLPNGDFEEWAAPEPGRAYWTPFLTDGIPFWATGNQGATTIGEKHNLSTPADDPRPGSSGAKSAHLASRWIFVKFAAGNLLTGEYFTTKGTNGIVGFGRPSIYRPTALRGWVKFKGGKINRVGGAPSGVVIEEGKTDESGIIYAMVGTWTPQEYGTTVDGERYGNTETPIAVYTKDLSTFINFNGKNVIGYGEKVMVENIDQWTEFTIPIVYKATNIVPTHIVVVCSASRYGDYFTGCDKSVLCVDDFELIYE